MIMDQYLERGKEILKILINNGCEAYLIGGAVCNTILELPFDEAEITTNATPDMVKGIFSEVKVEEEGLGSVRLYYYGYQFIVSTFKTEEKFRDNRKPVRIHYSKNLHDDLATRDFTINAIAMSHGGKLTDAYRGFEDLQKRKVRTIGNPKVRFSEDPGRILIALRFVSELGFNIESKTYRALCRKAKLLSNMEIPAMVKEIKRILNGKYFKKALMLIYKSGVYKRIPVLKYEFYRLATKYRPESIETFLACSFVQNKGFEEKWQELSQNPEQLRKVVELALNKPKCKYETTDLFTYGIDICLEANKVNNLLGKSRKLTRQIRRAFDALPIRSASEMTFTEKDLADLTGGSSSFNDQIYDGILMKVVKEELPNDFDALKAYAISSLKTFYGDNPPKEEVKPEVVAAAPSTLPEPNYIEEELAPLTEPVYQQQPYPGNQAKPQTSLPASEVEDLQRRIKELERQNMEIKLSRDVDNLVGQNLEMLKEMNYIDGTEKILISRELKELYRKLITNVNPRLRSLKNSDSIFAERNDDNNEKEN